jgi:isopentenyldiphosphate isomerase
MEIWDILDRHGVKTGRIVERGSKLEDNEFILAVHVYIYNSDGEFLVQKRSSQKVSRPGIWDVTGGAVLSVEDSKAAAIRVVKEELGIDLNMKEMKMIGRLKQRHAFTDIWFSEANFNLGSCKLQEEEVEDIKFVRSDELISIVFAMDYRQIEYKNLLTGYINNHVLNNISNKV